MKTVRGDDHYSTVLLNYCINDKRWRTKQKYYAIVDNIIFIMINTTVFCTAEDYDDNNCSWRVRETRWPVFTSAVHSYCNLLTSTALAVRRKQK